MTDTVINATEDDDVSYSTRHVEESWHHLMKSEDTAKFKRIAVCNFDFLLAAVSDDFSFATIEISLTWQIISPRRCKPSPSATCAA